MTARVRKHTLLLTAVFALMLTVSAALPAHAAIIPSCALDQTAKAADLNCVLETFENIAELILGVTGSFALLMFVYGGFTLLSSGGSEEKVTKGKTILRNSIIGILIIMLSGYLVRYAVESISGNGSLERPGAACTEVQGGRTYQTASGEVCAKSCSDLASEGYSCTTETAGKACLIGLCEGSQNQRCCPR